MERHVLQQLVLLAGVVADLRDDEAGALLDLPGQLEVLRHHLVLVALEVGGSHAEIEIDALDLRQELQQADGVEVEHR